MVCQIRSNAGQLRLCVDMGATKCFRCGHPGMHICQGAERAAANPAGRFGDAAEFGDACAYLCSAQAGYITGQNFLLDGGAYQGTF